MYLYVAQQNDTIYSIAKTFNITVEKLANDNGLEHPYRLITGQSIVIAHPKLSHTVQEGDTIRSIADRYSVSLIKLIRNNLFILERSIYLGESLTISYNTSTNITLVGFTYPYIKHDILIKTLPNLTYLSIFNYSVTKKGKIIENHNDSEIIKSSIKYGTIPLMMISSSTPTGEPNAEIGYNILLNEEAQENNINHVINIMKSKGYYGLNIVFNYLNVDSQSLYFNFTKKISVRLHKEGFLFFITINYNNQDIDNEIQVNRIDYSTLSKYVDGMIFLKFVWSKILSPPFPICNIRNLSTLMDYIVSKAPTDKILIGKPILGYDWQLPYIPHRSKVVSLSIESIFNLAHETNAIIQYDEISKTPYFLYNKFNNGRLVQHIVWFIDARSITILDTLVKRNSLYGCAVWNIMVYYPQLWALINSQFDIIKLI